MRNIKTILFYCLFVLVTPDNICAETTAGGSVVTTQSEFSLKANRFLTFNTIIRVNQIEVTRDKSVGADERALHTPERADNRFHSL